MRNKRCNINVAQARIKKRIFQKLLGKKNLKKPCACVPVQACMPVHEPQILLFFRYYCIVFNVHITFAQNGISRENVQ